jgi:LysM repeat protein
LLEFHKENPTLEKIRFEKRRKIKIPVTQASAEIVAQVTANSQQQCKKETTTSLNNNSGTTTVVRVPPNETKYAIAREYGISVADIDAANPILE